MISIIMGSDSDLPIMEETAKMLSSFGIKHELKILSAHRTPEAVRKYVKNAEKKDFKVFIAGAGAAAHLPGVIASHTTLPVIGVPLSSELKGLDSLLSIVQMPKGVPVATMAIGKAGAINAAILAVELLAISDKKIKQQLQAYRKNMVKEVLNKSKALRSKVLNPPSDASAFAGRIDPSPVERSDSGDAPPKADRRK